MFTERRVAARFVQEQLYREAGVYVDWDKTAVDPDEVAALAAKPDVLAVAVSRDGTTIATGDAVVVFGLKARPDANGRKGVVLGSSVLRNREMVFDMRSSTSSTQIGGGIGPCSGG